MALLLLVPSDLNSEEWTTVVTEGGRRASHVRLGSVSGTAPLIGNHLQTGICFQSPIQDGTRLKSVSSEEPVLLT